MKYNFLTAMIIVLSCTALTACAQSKKTRTAKKKGNTKPELLVAIKESNMLKGNRETSPEVKFVLVWKDAAVPSTFSWKGTGTWLICDLSIVKNYNTKTYSYSTEPLAKEISANDTLELKPISGAKYPMPKEIPADAENTIFYKTQAGLWKSIHVNDFERMRTEPGLSN